MSNEQLTGVEWFAEQIRNYKTPLNYGGVYFVFIHQDMINRFEQQAKEMEKEQIINAFWNGDNTDCTSERNIKEFAEQYYEQTYGGNK